MSEVWNVRITEICSGGLKANGNFFQKKIMLKFRMRIYRLKVVI